MTILIVRHVTLTRLIEPKTVSLNTQLSRVFLLCFFSGSSEIRATC